MLKRWRGGLYGPPPDGPYIADVRTFDIPATIIGCIQNAAPGMVAMTLCRRGGPDMIAAAEAAAKERGIRILWWNGPADPDNEAAKR